MWFGTILSELILLRIMKGSDNIHIILRIRTVFDQMGMNQVHKGTMFRILVQVKGAETG